MENKSIHIVLDNVRYNNNVGPIFRIARAFGVEKLYLCRDNREKFKNKKLEILKKASRGAIEFVDWSLYPDSVELIKNLKEQGIYIISIDIKTEKTIADKNLKITYPVALVFGTEAIGVKPEIIELSDQIIKIPMEGDINSLNVASAVAIVTYKIHELISIQK